MKAFKFLLLMLGMLCVFSTNNYAQYETLDVLYMIMDPTFPESGLNSDQIGMNVCHIGDINGDGYDDWAMGLPGAMDLESGIETGTVHIYLGGDIPASESPADLILAGKPDTYGFGGKISSAGDVNNDGFDDLLVKFIWHDKDFFVTRNSVALFYGGDPFDKEVDLVFTAVEGHANYFFGVVSDAGDVNDDGYDDIIIGAPAQFQGSDSAHAYVYYGGESMDNSADVVFTGDMKPPGHISPGAEHFALNACGAGDMNNDGYDDILISAGSGAKLYLGGADMDNTIDVLFNDLTGFGISPEISAAGDLNDDGFDDVILGAYVGGRAYICFGGETVDETSDLIIPGWAPMDYFGRSVSGAGDVNGDGVSDVIVGCDYNYLSTVRVYFGGTSMDSLPDVALFGDVQGDRFGYKVSIDGDLNNDGYSDIIIGGIGNYTTFSKGDDQGNIWLFYGGDPMDNESEAIFTGGGSSDYFAQRVAHAGDVNGDGFPDIVVGQAPYFVDPYYVGRAYLYLGSENPSNTPDLIFMNEKLAAHYNLGGLVRGAGDVNNDGFSDFIIAETNYNYNNCKAYLYLGGEVPDSIADLTLPFKIDAAAAVGDVNDDNFDDFIVSNEKTYLYYGSETVDNTADVVFDSTYRFVVSAGDLNGDDIQDFVIYGSKNGAPGLQVYFGNSSINTEPQLTLNDVYWCAEGRDINNDGYDDIVANDMNFDATPDGDEGRVYIYYGGETMDAIPDMTITGDSVGVNLGRKLMTIPDLNGDGYDEVLISQSRHPEQWVIVSKLYIYYGGAPMDTIPDIVLPYSHGLDISVYSHPTEDYVGIIVGDPNLGAVIIHSNSSLVGIDGNVETTSVPRPGSFELFQNYPNPFNPVTTIRYTVGVDGGDAMPGVSISPRSVELSIYNLLGQKIATLVSKKQTVGKYTVKWDASSLPSGIYLYRLEVGGAIQSRKMLLVR